MKHQGWRLIRRGFLPLCSACPLAEDCESYSAEEGATCGPLAAAREGLIEQITGLPHIDPVIDLPTVTQYVNARLFLALIEVYASHAGPFLPGAAEGFLELQPALAKSYVSFSNLARRLAADLGLTPAARAKLEGRGESGAGAMLAEALRQAQAGPAVDADFVSEEVEASDATPTPKEKTDDDAEEPRT